MLLIVFQGLVILYTFMSLIFQFEKDEEDMREQQSIEDAEDKNTTVIEHLVFWIFEMIVPILLLCFLFYFYDSAVKNNLPKLEKCRKIYTCLVIIFIVVSIIEFFVRMKKFDFFALVAFAVEAGVDVLFLLVVCKYEGVTRELISRNIQLPDF